MEVLAVLSTVTPAQLELFGVAAALSAGLFSGGFLLGRASKNRDVKVPIEVIHALAANRFGPQTAKAQTRAHDSNKEDDIEHAIEALLDHVEHKEKDFKHAHDYALHEIDRIIHDFGSTPDLAELRKKVDAAHSIAEIVSALKWYIDRHHH